MLTALAACAGRQSTCPAPTDQRRGQSAQHHPRRRARDRLGEICRNRERQIAALHTQRVQTAIPARQPPRANPDP
jgi:hypothetical protein